MATIQIESLPMVHRSLRRVFVETILDTVLVIVTDVVANQPPQVIFIENDHMMQQIPRQQLPTQRSASPFCQDFDRPFESNDCLSF